MSIYLINARLKKLGLNGEARKYKFRIAHTAQTNRCESGGYGSASVVSFTRILPHSFQPQEQVSQSLLDKWNLVGVPKMLTHQIRCYYYRLCVCVPSGEHSIRNGPDDSRSGFASMGFLPETAIGQCAQHVSAEPFLIVGEYRVRRYIFRRWCLPSRLYLPNKFPSFLHPGSLSRWHP